MINILGAELMLERSFYFSKEICFIWSLYWYKWLESNVKTKSVACQGNEGSVASDPRIPVADIKVLQYLNNFLHRSEMYLEAQYLWEASWFVFRASISKQTFDHDWTLRRLWKYYHHSSKPCLRRVSDINRDKWSNTFADNRNKRVIFLSL